MHDFTFGPCQTWLEDKVISCGGVKKCIIWDLERGSRSDELSYDVYCNAIDVSNNGHLVAVAYGLPRTIQDNTED